MSSSVALSSELEDYLETIASLIRDVGRARVRDISETLSVHKSTVTAALHRLSEKGLINYRPYSSPTLTQAGRKIADRVQDRHDTLKRFFADVLLVDPALAEANACRLEHAVDKEILDHLTRFVDFVQRCPRGGSKWIRGYEHSCDPPAEKETCLSCMELAAREFRGEEEAPAKEITRMTLDKLKPGQKAKIRSVGRTGPVTRRIADMGVGRGATVEMIKVAPLGDPMEIRVRGYNLTLRKEEAAAIKIEAEE